MEESGCEENIYTVSREFYVSCFYRSNCQARTFRKKVAHLPSFEDEEETLKEARWSVVMNNAHICSGHPISNCGLSRPPLSVLPHLGAHPKNHFHPIAAFSPDFAAYQIMDF